MTTSEQAALLAKHYEIRSIISPNNPGFCRECEDAFPCDVHKMAELKDAEIAQAVSEAVERIVEALEAESLRIENESRRLGSQFREIDGDGLERGLDHAIELLRSRDWSTGDA